MKLGASLPVAKAVTIMVRPSAENPNLLRKVIRKPNPPINIMWMSMITATQKWQIR